MRVPHGAATATCTASESVGRVAADALDAPSPARPCLSDDMSVAQLLVRVILTLHSRPPPAEAFLPLCGVRTCSGDFLDGGGQTFFVSTSAWPRRVRPAAAVLSTRVRGRLPQSVHALIDEQTKRVYQRTAWRLADPGMEASSPVSMVSASTW